MGFVQYCSPSRLVKTTIAQLLPFFEMLAKNCGGVAKIWNFFSFSCFYILGSEAEILTIEFLKKILQIYSFFGHAGLQSIGHLALAKTTFPLFAFRIYCPVSLIRQPTPIERRYLAVRRSLDPVFKVNNLQGRWRRNGAVHFRC